MSKAKQTLVEAFLERVSRGAVPMGGFYSIDPKDLRRRSETVTSAKNAIDGEHVSKSRDAAARAATARAATARDAAARDATARDATARDATARDVAAPKAAPHAL
jgi:hypothetical protein